jgi:predicted metal-binding membrane protein
MAAAMMAPTALPAFATYEDLGHSTETRTGALVAGYLGVWLGFSVLAAGAQMALFDAGLLTAFGDSRSGALSAALLALAGAYQFSPAKAACLSKCRRPLAFFMAHWDEGAWRNGVRLGLVCLGCCWALMALAFVGGVMNLAFMGLATVIMVLEKLPQPGRYLTRPLGVVLLAASGWVLFTTI